MTIFDLYLVFCSNFVTFLPDLSIMFIFTVTWGLSYSADQQLCMVSSAIEADIAHANRLVLTSRS